MEQIPSFQNRFCKHANTFVSVNLTKASGMYCLLELYNTSIIKARVEKQLKHGHLCEREH